MTRGYRSTYFGQRRHYVGIGLHYLVAGALENIFNSSKGRGLTTMQKNDGELFYVGMHRYLRLSKKSPVFWGFIKKNGFY